MPELPGHARTGLWVLQTRADQAQAARQASKATLACESFTGKSTAPKQWFAWHDRPSLARKSHQWS